MTTSTTTVENKPKFLAVWKSGLPIAFESAKQHPLLSGGLIFCCFVYGFVPMMGLLAGVGAMICLLFIEYTIMKAAYSELTEGAPRYELTNTTLQWRMVLVTMCVNFITFWATLLLIIPGVWFMVKSALSALTVCLEGKEIKAAIERSHELTKGNWLMTFWFRSLAPGLVTLLVFIALVVVGVGIMVPVNLISKDLADMLKAPLFMAFLLAFYTVYLTMAPPLVHLYAYLTGVGRYANR